MVHQGPVIIAGCLKSGPDRQAKLRQNARQTPKILNRVCDGQLRRRCLPGAAIHTSWRCLEMSRLAHAGIRCRAADAYQNTSVRSQLNLGPARSPLWCGSQNNYRDPRPGYDRPLRNFEAAQATIISSNTLFRTRHGKEFAEQPRNRNTIYSRPMRFGMICATNGIEHRLTKPKYPWMNGQVERMNRTIKDATVKLFPPETHDQLRTHLADFLAAYNFARRLKTLNGLTPYEYICKI